MLFYYLFFVSIQLTSLALYTLTFSFDWAGIIGAVGKIFAFQPQGPLTQLSILPG